MIEHRDLESDAIDPLLWLEEVEGDDALAWVRSQNERTLSALQADPRYAGFEAAALEVLTANDRIPYGTIRDGFVYNFWQDEMHWLQLAKCGPMRECVMRRGWLSLAVGTS